MDPDYLPSNGFFRKTTKGLTFREKNRDKGFGKLYVHQDTLEVGSMLFLEVGCALSLAWRSNASYIDNKDTKVRYSHKRGLEMRETAKRGLEHLPLRVSRIDGETIYVDDIAHGQCKFNGLHPRSFGTSS